jgi:DNA-binding MarR family transcriptional regulator
MRLEELAHRVCGLLTHFCLAAPRGRRRPGGLKEVEFLTLAILRQHDSCIVGNIQRRLGVLPAQMSRIIRSLEDRDRPLIACRINPGDKRKIDVCLTPAGERALADYEAQRLRAITELLRQLPEEDQEDLDRVVEKLQGVLDRE